MVMCKKAGFSEEISLVKKIKYEGVELPVKDFIGRPGASPEVKHLIL